MGTKYFQVPNDSDVPRLIQSLNKQLREISDVLARVGETTDVVPPPGGGSGDFVGPSSAVPNNLVAFDGPTGKLGKDAGASVTRIVEDTAASAAAALASEQAAAVSEDNAATSETNASDSETAAAQSASDASDSADDAAASVGSGSGFISTSTTPLTIGEGASFPTIGLSTQADKFFDVGTTIKITSDANINNFTTGIVAFYDNVIVVLNVTAIGGSGTFSDWTIRVIEKESKLEGTSLNSVTVGTGLKGWVTQVDKYFDAGTSLLITSDANPNNFMLGIVAFYEIESVGQRSLLGVDITHIGGSGTFSDWTIRVSGLQALPEVLSSPSQIGNVTPNTIKATTFEGDAGGTTINEFSTDDTMAGDSDDAVPTEKAVKAFVDNQIGGLGSAAFEDVGVAPNNVVQLDFLSRLPTVDGSQLTNLSSDDDNLINGLKCSNDVSFPNDTIVVNTGKARDFGDAATMTVSVTARKRINLNWVEGNNQGGLDTGTVAASQGYGIYLISRSDTSNVDIILSLDMTPDGATLTLPANYDAFRLIGFVTTDASSNITKFQQVGDIFTVNNQSINIVDTSPSGTNVVALELPPSSLVFFYVQQTLANNNTIVRWDVFNPLELFASNFSSMVVVSDAFIGVLSIPTWVLLTPTSQIVYANVFPTTNTTFTIEPRICNMLTRSNPR